MEQREYVYVPDIPNCDRDRIYCQWDAWSHPIEQRPFNVFTLYLGITAMTAIEGHQLCWVTPVDFVISTRVLMHDGSEHPRRELADATALVKLRQCILYRRLASAEATKASKTTTEIGIRLLTCYMYPE
jgi:hypothetical protein